MALNRLPDRNRFGGTPTFNPPDDSGRPLDIDRLLGFVNGASSAARNTWLAFLGVSAYLLIALVGVTHRDLFLNTPTELPIVRIEIPLLGFARFAPFLLVFLHLGLLLQHAQLAKNLGHLDAAFRREEKASGRSEPRRRLVHAYVFSQLLAGPKRTFAYGMLMWTMALSSIVATPVLVILFTQAVFLPLHDEWLTWSHRAAILLDIGLVIFFAPFLIRPLSLRKDKAPLFSFGPREMPWSMTGAWFAFVSFSASLVVLFSVFVATFPYETTDRLTRQLAAATGPECVEHVDPDGDPDTEERYFAECERLQVFYPTELFFDGDNGRSFLGFSRNLILIDEVLSTRSEPRAFPDARLDFARLDGANFGGAVLDAASLRWATAVGANFDGANLAAADLYRANLSFASLRDVTFWQDEAEIDPLKDDYNTLESERTRIVLQIENDDPDVVVFVEAAAVRTDEGPTHLGWCQFRDDVQDLLNFEDLEEDLEELEAEESDRLRVALQNLREPAERLLMRAEPCANLHYTTFRGADLRGADLSSVAMYDANLMDALLVGVDFSHAWLDGVNFTGADMTVANFFEASLPFARLVDTTARGASFVRADLVGAELYDLHITGANITDLDVEYAEVAEVYGRLLHCESAPFAGEGENTFLDDAGRPVICADEMNDLSAEERSRRGDPVGELYFAQWHDWDLLPSRHGPDLPVLERFNGRRAPASRGAYLAMLACRDDSSVVLRAVLDQLGFTDGSVQRDLEEGLTLTRSFPVYPPDLPQDADDMEASIRAYWIAVSRPEAGARINLQDAIQFARAWRHPDIRYCLAHGKLEPSIEADLAALSRIAAELDERFGLEPPELFLEPIYIDP